MKQPLQLVLMVSVAALLGACASKAPRYPNLPTFTSPAQSYRPALTPLATPYPAPPQFTSQVQSYQPTVSPLAPASYPVPVAPLAVPNGAVFAGSDVIAEQDLLDVTVFKVPDLSRSLRVDTRGNITFPLIGAVRARGLKPAQLEREIARRLGQTYINNPQVSVLLKESVQNRITVEGAVRQPGVFPVTGRMTLLQAVALAGGLTEQADTRRAILLRSNGRGQVSQQPIDIAAIRQGRIQDFPLLQDDRIVVQEAVMNRFTVAGSVANPGVFPLKEGMTVLQAVATAGGASRDADKRRAVLFRHLANGRVQRYDLDMGAIQSGRSVDPMIQQDDRIVVQEEAATNRFTVTGAVANPGVFPYKEGMTFLQAIATAGGATRLADKGRAVLFRRLPDGRVQRYSVDLNAVYTGRSPDPMLQQDDRIVLGESGGRALFEDATRLIAPVSLF